MRITVPLEIPNDAVFRVKLKDGTMFRKGKVFKSLSAAKNAISSWSLEGATILVHSLITVYDFKYNPYGRA
jgi:hypothetical protein